MRELDRRIAILRLRLAEVRAREERIDRLRRQLRGQLARLMDFAVFDRGDLDAALSMADDVESRLSQADRTLGHLETIKTRGQEELDALLLTSSIEAAKTDVAELETQLQKVDEEIGTLVQIVPRGERASHAEGASKLTEMRAQHERLDSEIKRLRQAISEASDAAARTVTKRAGPADLGPTRSDSS